jgi:hypothetical protein
MAVAPAGRLAVVGAVGGALLSPDPLDRGARPLPVGPLSRVARLGTEGPVRIRDLVAAPLLLDLGRGLAPGPPTPGRPRHRAQRLQDIAGPVGLNRHAGGAPLPGQGPHHLPVGRTKMSVGLQPADAPAAGAGAASARDRGPGWPAGWPPPTHPAPGRLIAAAQPAKHPGRLAAEGLLVGGQGLLGLLVMSDGPRWVCISGSPSLEVTLQMERIGGVNRTLVCLREGCVCDCALLGRAAAIGCTPMVSRIDGQPLRLVGLT